MNTQFDDLIRNALRARLQPYAPYSRFVVGAAAAGQRELVTIAVVADTIEPIVPCGACRQFLAEFSPDLIIVSATVEGTARSRTFLIFFRTRSAEF